MSEDFKEVQDMLEQAKEIVKTLENKYNELKDKPKNVRWRGNNYYYLCLQGFKGQSGEYEAVITSDSNSNIDNSHYNIGNYFKTKEESEKSYNNLIITQKLKDIALRLNNGIDIDWTNRKQNKFSIFTYVSEDNTAEELYQDFNQYLKRHDIYCLSPKFLETAVKEIGEKELIEYIKGC